MDWQKLKNVAVTERVKWQLNSRYLIQSIELEETDPPGTLSAMVYTICGLILFIIIWAGITRVDEVARAEGEITPMGFVQAVQHLEGGIVSKIYVRDGEIVKKGQPLLKLAPIDMMAKLDQIRARRAATATAIERNRAIAEGRTPQFSDNLSGYTELKSDQLALFETETETNILQRSVLAQQLEQQLGERTKLENQLRSQKEEVALLNKEWKLRKDLFDRGLSTRETVFNIERQLGQGKLRFAEIEDSLDVSKNSILEAQKRIDEFDTGIRTSSLTVIGELVGQLAEIQESLKSLTDKVDRLNVVAPIDGIVKGLRVNAINAVVQPGQTLLELVPTSGDVIVEAKISTINIGQILVGQEVDVRVITYDFSTYGSLKGRLEKISASTFQSEDGIPYYKATVSLPKSHFGDDPEESRLLPGMTVQANIIVGSKSILDYMMKPIYRGLTKSFQER